MIIKQVLSCFGYNTCLICGMIGLILSGFGISKFKNAGIIAIGVYIICMILMECLQSVKSVNINIFN